MTEFETALREIFPVRSEIQRELKPRTGKLLRLYSDLIYEPPKYGGAIKFLKLIKDALPEDAYLLDNAVSLEVYFPCPVLRVDGLYNYSDAHCIVIGSDEWPTNAEGSVFSLINAIFTKDPATWAVTCKIVEENQQ